MATFTEQVAAWARKAEGRAKATAKFATLAVANEASEPVPEGRMPVYTGFLRNSINANVGTMPSGPSLGPILLSGGEIRWRDPMGDRQIVSAKLASWDVTGTMYVGWTAEYADYQEDIHAFMHTAADGWQTQVRKAVVRSKELLP